MFSPSDKKRSRKRRARPASGLDGLGPLDRTAEEAPLPALYTRRPPITWGRRAPVSEPAKRDPREGAPSASAPPRASQARG